MNKVIFWVLAMGVASGTAHACDGDAAQWGRDFASLRQVRGHFDGGPWSAEADRWDGAKHRVMRCLAADLSRPGATTRRLRLQMGPPDTRVPCPGGHRCEQWAYHWRGVHDRLLFTVAGGRILKVDWDLALE